MLQVPEEVRTHQSAPESISNVSRRQARKPIGWRQFFSRGSFCPGAKLTIKINEALRKPILNLHNITLKQWPDFPGSGGLRWLSVSWLPGRTTSASCSLAHPLKRAVSSIQSSPWTPPCRDFDDGCSILRLKWERERASEFSIQWARYLLQHQLFKSPDTFYTAEASGDLSCFQFDCGKTDFTPIGESCRLDKCSIPSTPQGSWQPSLTPVLGNPTLSHRNTCRQNDNTHKNK